MKISIWDILSVLALFGTFVIILVSSAIFANPNSVFNPFPPLIGPAQVVLPTATETPRSLPPTWTPMAGGEVPVEETPRITSTLPPTSTMFVISTFTPTATPTDTPTNTPTPTRTPTITKTPTLTPTKTPNLTGTVAVIQTQVSSQQTLTAALTQAAAAAQTAAAPTATTTPGP